MIAELSPPRTSVKIGFSDSTIRAQMRSTRSCNSGATRKPATNRAEKQRRRPFSAKLRYRNTTFWLSLLTNSHELFQSPTKETFGQFAIVLDIVNVNVRLAFAQ